MIDLRLRRAQASASAVTTIYAVAAAEAGTAIVSARRDGDDVTVSAIDRLPAGLGPAADWLRDQIPDHYLPSETTVVIDSDGLGQALYEHLSRRRFTLYRKKGRDRQELVNALLQAQASHRVHIKASDHGFAMRRALIAYKKTVGDDGEFGGELVVALALAVLTKRSVPRVY